MYVCVSVCLCACAANFCRFLYCNQWVHTKYFFKNIYHPYEHNQPPLVLAEQLVNVLISLR